MNPAVLIVTLVITAYSTRIAGFAFRGRSMPPAVQRFLSGVPVAAFAALIMIGLDFESAGWDARLIAAGPAAFVAWKWKRLWLTLIVGMAGYWVIGSLIN
jgi:branched-subunit amino acid transport protein